MPKIIFADNKRPEITVKSGDNLLWALRDKDIPVASSCHGDGVCGKCVVNVLAGGNSLQKPNETEQFLLDRFNYKKPQRISCQICVGTEDLTLATSYW